MSIENVKMEKKTPLLISYENKNENIVKLLIENGGIIL